MAWADWALAQARAVALRLQSELQGELQNRAGAHSGHGTDAVFLTAYDGATVLNQRLPELGLNPEPRLSPNGSCRLLAVGSRWLALNLARADDWSLLPAWLQRDKIFADWQSVLDALADASRDSSAPDAAALVARGRDMSLPIALLPELISGQAVANSPSVASNSAGGSETSLSQNTVSKSGPNLAADLTSVCPLHQIAEVRQRKPLQEMLVVDLAALWAGPLCSHVLQQAGCQVVKIESSQRPDGARWGTPDFFQRIHAGKTLREVDFRSATELHALRDLLASADIVIEGSRPAALQRLGLDRRSIARHRATAGHFNKGIRESDEAGQTGADPRGSISSGSISSGSIPSGSDEHGFDPNRAKQSRARQSRARQSRFQTQILDPAGSSNEPLWVAVTAYGLSQPFCNWVGFGDDVAAAAGLMQWVAGEPRFCGDAVADPLTGLFAAAAILERLHAGQTGLLEASMFAVAQHCRHSLPTWRTPSSSAPSVAASPKGHVG